MQQLIVFLSCGREVLTEFKNIRSEFANAKSKNCNPFKCVHKQISLIRKNLVDAALFFKDKENHKKTYIKALKNSKYQIFNIAADKVVVAKRFYEEFYNSIPINQTLQYKFLHVPRLISTGEHYEFLSTAISKTEIYNTICEMKNAKTSGPDDISVEFYKKTLTRYW